MAPSSCTDSALVDSVDYLEVKCLDFVLLFYFPSTLSGRQGEWKNSEALVLQ